MEQTLEQLVRQRRIKYSAALFHPISTIGYLQRSKTGRLDRMVALPCKSSLSGCQWNGISQYAKCSTMINDAQIRELIVDFRQKKQTLFKSERLFSHRCSKPFSSFCVSMLNQFLFTVLKSSFASLLHGSIVYGRWQSRFSTTPEDLNHVWERKTPQ